MELQLQLFKTPKKKCFIFGTNGSGSKDLIVENSASNFKINQEPRIFMDGKKVFLFTMTNIPNIVIDLLKKDKITLDSIKYFIFHQASKTVIDNLVRKLNLPRKKFSI